MPREDKVGVVGVSRTVTSLTVPQKARDKEAPMTQVCAQSDLSVSTDKPEEAAGLGTSVWSPVSQRRGPGQTDLGRHILSPDILAWSLGPDSVEFWGAESPTSSAALPKAECESECGGPGRDTHRLATPSGVRWGPGPRSRAASPAAERGSESPIWAQTPGSLFSFVFGLQGGMILVMVG